MSKKAFIATKDYGRYVKKGDIVGVIEMPCRRIFGEGKSVILYYSRSLNLLVNIGYLKSHFKDVSHYISDWENPTEQEYNFLSLMGI